MNLKMSGDVIFVLGNEWGYISMQCTITNIEDSSAHLKSLGKPSSRQNCMLWGFVTNSNRFAKRFSKIYESFA